MTIIRVGTTKRYSEGWEAAFGRKGGAKAAVKMKSAAALGEKSKKKSVAKAQKKAKK